MSIICLLVTAVIITAISIISIFCEVVRLAAKQKRKFDGFTFRELCSLAKYDKEVAVGGEVTLWLLTNQMRCVERKLIKKSFNAVVNL